MFATDTAVYYKNPNMLEMDAQFGDIYAHICDKEIEIIQALGETSLEHEELLNEVSDICGEVGQPGRSGQRSRQAQLRYVHE